ncbi:MAG: hypothetical protein M1814_002952 [Vezdaea aestivalis]|nr:MAG: hypothetical protein M1814_002952 [Vezdaea aestivalis]
MFGGAPLIPKLGKENSALFFELAEDVLKSMGIGFIVKTPRADYVVPDFDLTHELLYAFVDQKFPVGTLRKSQDLFQEFKERDSIEARKRKMEKYDAALSKFKLFLYTYLNETDWKLTQFHLDPIKKWSVLKEFYEGLALSEKGRNLKDKLDNWKCHELELSPEDAWKTVKSLGESLCQCLPHLAVEYNQEKLMGILLDGLPDAYDALGTSIWKDLKVPIKSKLELLTGRWKFLMEKRIKEEDGSDTLGQTSSRGDNLFDYPQQNQSGTYLAQGHIMRPQLTKTHLIVGENEQIRQLSQTVDTPGGDDVVYQLTRARGVQRSVSTSQKSTGAAGKPVVTQDQSSPNGSMLELFDGSEIVASGQQEVQFGPDSASTNNDKSQVLPALTSAPSAGSRKRGRNFLGEDDEPTIQRKRR